MPHLECTQQVLYLDSPSDNNNNNNNNNKKNVLFDKSYYHNVKPLLLNLEQRLRPLWTVKCILRYESILEEEVTHWDA